MKRPFKIINTLIALSLFILGTFLFWSLSTQTAEVLETPDTGGVASNEIFLPVIEGGDGDNDTPVMNDTQEELSLEQAVNSPTTVPTKENFVQTVMDSDGPCMRVEDGDFRFDLIGYKENNDGTTKIVLMINNQGDEPVQTVSFANAGWQIASPKDGEKAMGVYSEYVVSLSETDGTLTLSFEAMNTEFKGNKTDIFAITAHDLDPQSPIESHIKAGLEEQSASKGQTSFILHDTPCKGTVPASESTTRADNSVPTPSPIDWDEPPPCVNEPWDHTQWSNQLITQRTDTQEQRSLKTLFQHQLQPMSSFLQDETVDSVADLFIIDDRTASSKSRLERDTAALWFNVLYGKLNRATEVSFSNPDLAGIKTVGDLLDVAEDALANDSSSDGIQSGLRQLLAGQDITRPICGHMIHMRSGNKFEESIWDSEKVDTQIQEQVQGANNLRVGLAHMEPSPDYSMVAMESWGYESGGPIFLYDTISAQVTNLIETLGIPDTVPGGHLILSRPWQVLGWSSNSRNLLLGIEGSASAWWVDVEELTYRTISLGYSGSINASKQYVDMLPDGSGFVYINRHFIDSDPEQGPQLLLYDFASDESTLLRELPKVRGTLMSYPRVSPDSRSVVYLLETLTEEQDPVDHYALYLLDIESQAQYMLAERDLDLLDGGVVWSPDGENIAFTSRQPGSIRLPGKGSKAKQRNIIVIDINSSEWTKLTSVQGIATNPSWSFSGRSLSFVTHNKKVGLVSLDHPEKIWQIGDAVNSGIFYMASTFHLP